jgi:hypothetical protein
VAQDLKKILIGRGFHSIKAKIWSEFVSSALALYWQAVDILTEPARWSEFENKVGAMGKPRQNGSIKGIQFAIEDAITSEIGFIVQDLRGNLPIDHILRKYEAQFLFESPVESDEKAGRYLSRVDHLVRSCMRDGPELAIEAKPLISPSDVTGRYLADDGIGCFLRPESTYSKGPLGAMWAYSMGPDADSFREDIIAGLRKYKPTISQLDQVVGLYSSSQNKEIDCSLHDRTAIGLVPITLLHLECSFPSKTVGL